MLAIRLFLFSLAATALAACGPKLKDLPETSFAPVYAPADKTAATATIRGAYREKEGLIKDSVSGAYVAMIDGERPSRNYATDPIQIAPGPHSLTARYFRPESLYFPIPFRLDAKPGASYVVRLEEGELTVENYLGKGPVHHLYIVEETTGEIVSPKMPHLAEKAEEFYAPPSAPDVATIHGTVTSNGLDRSAAYVLAIDGRYAPVKPSIIFAGSGRDYNATYAVTPGLHALAIGIESGWGFDTYPIMLDAQPGASYVLRFEMGFKKNGEDKWIIFTVWVEDEKSHQVIWPKTDLPAKRLPL